ncbi:acyl-CoA ligase (AMP-forming), exosortase A system-associated [Pseudomaricurvus alkylphenolicus]|uniref:acyl-CoA ligase (AMP-forming), exosortase A system-associated n=1 Tax=Pseudomaricurvus alkylphenolicus TaxID=1306991 RepID=UPI001424045E|nr:acyl-CoA ligase (AMP-forming), exosortase A system-associated [Pseudomaricurvus alkylphenolicus]NIB43112.1 acyl-CoA ligase (AMP-forming), exosortase A system-associated [Pseudomaricurvus alkylphenolicus]
MPEQLHQLIENSAARYPDSTALVSKATQLNYRELWQAVQAAAFGLANSGLQENQRVALYLPKVSEAVVGCFGTSLAGGVFVPINPLLKPAQVKHILLDCNVHTFITSTDRLVNLQDTLSGCPALKNIVYIGRNPTDEKIEQPHSSKFIPWEEIAGTQPDSYHSSARIDTDMAAILYTSGSTGKPKGVVLSHRNMLCGADSVVQFLQNTRDDRLLAVMPFSFDYGFSQLTTAFLVGAQVIMLDYLFPRDLIKAVTKHRITGLAAVPPLWNQLVKLDWPEEAQSSLRYLTNTGGAMPKATTSKLIQALPNTSIYLMYGLTEAFRSTYLSPEEIHHRPGSIGKAIPNAKVMVVRKDGSPCLPNEPGELVHMGSLVTLGYWNDPAKTAERFKPAPSQPGELPLAETAVWSGDRVYKDEDGFFYFVSRNDEMIKTSGYRVSPSELEDVLHQSGLVEDVAALGIPHPELGQAIVVVASSTSATADDIKQACLRELPSYMQPHIIELMRQLPKNTNGKLDRSALKKQYSKRSREENPETK